MILPRTFSLYCLALLATSFGALYGEKIVQCIANFPVDAAFHTQMLQTRGYDGRVILTSIDEYDAELLKRKGRIHKFLRLINLDFPFHASVAEEVDKIVFFNIDPRIIRRYDISRFPKERLVLFMWEPKTVLPQMYTDQIHDCFSKVYTWDDSLVDNKSYFKFYYPVLRPQIDGIPPFNEKKLCALVASNLTSKDPYELYSHRKETIAYFEAVNEPGFEFYGRGWDPLEHPSYRGEAPEKLSTIKNYRFYICYENREKTQGYVTEKIFDCFAAGTVPIYWGASNISDFVPQDCFINRADFATLGELHNFISFMPEEVYNEYLLRAELFLKSPVAKKFSYETFGQAFYEAVVN